MRCGLEKNPGHSALFNTGFCVNVDIDIKWTMAA